MPGLVVVQGGKASLVPTGTWVPVAGLWQISFQSMGTSMVTCEKKPPVEMSDVMLSFVGQSTSYIDAAFTVPGQMTIVEAAPMAGTTAATNSFGFQEVVIQTTTGTFTASVTSPAMNVQGIPDPVVVKTGTWTVMDPGQTSVSAL